MELNREYNVCLLNGQSFFGLYKGSSDGLLEFLTTDTNKEINAKGHSFIKVPATYFVNIDNAVLFKEIEEEEKSKLYFTISKNDYDQSLGVHEVYLTDEQKGNFDLTLYSTREEAEKALKKKEEKQ